MRKLVFTYIYVLFLFCGPFAQAEKMATRGQAKPVAFPVNGPAIPARLLQNPVTTKAEVQIISLSLSQAENTLGKSLAEINNKLQGLLKQIRQPAAFRGGTLLLEPQAGSTGENSMLLIRLGHSQALTASDR